MTTAEQTPTTRGLDLDTLIGELVRLRDYHGNMPVAVWEDRQSKTLGVDGVTVDTRPGADPVLVLMADEGRAPEATWGWDCLPPGSGAFNG